MDDKLKEAIAAVRTGDKQTAQRQLAELLDENPEQVQGWYLLSLLVDSPQKQAAYLSKTLSLNPNHEKARAQLAILQQANVAPSQTTASPQKQEMDVLTQSETEELPDWLQEASEASDITAVPAESTPETAVTSEDLPDWLKEPVSMQKETAARTIPVEEGPTLVGQTAEASTKSDKIVAELKQTLDKPKPSQPRKARAKPQNTQSLNIILGVLVTIAILVIIVLAYLLIS